jgi:beta-lactamase class A
MAVWIMMKKGMQTAKRLMMVWVILALLPAGLLCAQKDSTSLPGQAPRGPREMLASEIGRLARLSGGVVGVSAIHIESQKRISVNGRERFPMASAYKIPIAVQLMTLVDRGELEWNRMVDIRETDLRPGSGVLAKLFNRPGLVVSLRNLFEIMMVVSDNTATDALLSAAGGPGAVTRRMKAIGIGDIDVSRSVIEMIAASSGIQKLPPDTTPARFDRLEREADPGVKKKMRRQFEADGRDTATPDAMVSLLQGIYRGDFLKMESAGMLLDAMQRSQTGEARLKGMLPPGTPVAHKSGTLGGSTNDVGVITLPDDGGHVAIAIFVKASKREAPEREKAIAEIARAVYDFYLFGCPASP